MPELYPEPPHQETVTEKIGSTITTNAPAVVGKIISVGMFGFVRIVRGIINVIKESIHGY